METFREFTRAFFSLFLTLSCFIGCCHSLYWMEEISANAAKPVIYNNYKKSYMYDANEEYIREENDTIEVSRKYYRY